jgi:alanine dehydrogenase
MLVGVPKEIKANEDRVAITQAGVQAMVMAGHRVVIESGAGLGSGITDEAYLAAGAELVASPAEVYGRAEMVIKVNSVIVDVAIDQGGSVETIDRVTTHGNPVYEKHGVLHYAVANMPGAVARTSTFALTNATLPYALELANHGFKNAIERNPALARGVNAYKGNLTCRAVGESLNINSCDLSGVLRRLNVAPPHHTEGFFL